MFAACLFCATDFPPNDTVERAPHGRRFAFDQARGRLWIVCRSCHRWNLTPFEDRWEIIEDCERLFRATQVRLSTDHIGLARLPDGTDLVRVGDPLRPEFAAWRYSREFRSRRPFRVLRPVAEAGLLAAPPVLSLLLGPLAPLALAGAAGFAAYRVARHPSLRVPLRDGDELWLSASHVESAELIRDESAPEGWALIVDHLDDPVTLGRLDFHKRFTAERAVLTGAEARSAVTFLLPRLNPYGGNAREVGEAVRWIEAVHGPDRAFAAFAHSKHVRPYLDSNKATLATLHPEVRLALEMAVHEDEEWRLLQGELSVLEAAWRREERLAAIADRLTVPGPVAAQLDDMRSGISRAR